MLNTRQKCLFYFLKKSKKCSKLKLAKIFFIISKEDRINKNFKFYSFVPYKFGPYSFELFHDIEIFERKKMLTIDKDTVSYLNAEITLSPKISRLLDYYLEELFTMNDTELIDYVYKKYPEYTIFSKIKKKMEYIRDEIGISTIGYEGKSIDEFMMKLIQDKVDILVDVRNNPWSMKFGYKKYNLQSFCEKMKIEYLSLPSLGIPGNLRESLKTKKDYDELFKHYRIFITKKTEELEKLKSIAKDKKIALMCFEKDPNYCHRSIIADELIKKSTLEVLVN